MTLRAMPLRKARHTEWFHETCVLQLVQKRVTLKDLGVNG